MVDGKWVASLPAAEEIKGGRFVRMDSLFRNAVSADPAAQFPAEAGRYHLWVAWGCPWAARTLAVRALKWLDELVPAYFALAAFDGSEGWTYDDGPEGMGGEPYPLHRIYSGAVPNYTGKVTVPTLWDSQTNTIVSNESSEIVRMFNSAFDRLTGNRLDLYPEPLRPEIDRWNDYIYPRINNGVYRSGFATAQEAYDEAVRELFGGLDTVERRLETHRYLAGEYCTEADWRLFATLVRFDIGYYGAFKCNLRRIEDYLALSNYLRELYQWPGIAETVWLERIKADYYGLANVNPSRIVPIGPEVDLTKPHDREKLAGKGIWEG
jgi:putative glutathione S-transferase